MDEKVKYWLEMSEYDLVTAQAMLESERYLSEDKCISLIEKTRELQEWVKTKL